MKTIPTKAIPIDELKEGMYFTHQDGTILKIIKLNSKADDSYDKNYCKTLFIKPYENADTRKEYPEGFEKYYHTEKIEIANNIIDLSDNEIKELIVIEAI